MKGPLLYVIRDASGLVKVGATLDIERRLKEYATHSPGAFLAATRRVRSISELALAERAAHLILGDYRTSGEWFYCSERAAIHAAEAARRVALAVRVAKDEIGQIEIDERN